MHVFKRLTLGMSVLLVLGTAVVAQAQTPATPGTAKPAKQAKQGGGRGAALAQMPVSALDFAVGGLKDDQKTKITSIQTTFKTDSQAAAGDKTKLGDLTTKADTDIQGVLTPDQAAKLKEVAPTITLLNSSKAVPINALADVKLTEDQMGKIKTAATETTDKIKALPKADRKAKTPELRAEFKTKVDGILTDAQKDAIAKAPRAKRAKKQNTTPKPPQ